MARMQIMQERLSAIARDATPAHIGIARNARSYGGETGQSARMNGGRSLSVVTCRVFRHGTPMEPNQLRQQITDLAERVSALRRYL